MAETLQEALARKERYLQALMRLADDEQAERAARCAHLAPPTPAAPTTVTIGTLLGDPGLPRDARLLRRLLEAVALCEGAPSPGREVPTAWVPLVRQLHAARSRGLSWRAALSEVGLTPPDDLTPLLQQRQRALAAAWALLPGILGRVEERTPGIGRQRLRDHLRQLLM